MLVFEPFRDAPCANQTAAAKGQLGVCPESGVMCVLFSTAPEPLTAGAQAHLPGAALETIQRLHCVGEVSLPASGDRVRAGVMRRMAWHHSGPRVSGRAA